MPLHAPPDERDSQNRDATHPRSVRLLAASAGAVLLLLLTGACSEPSRQGVGLAPIEPAPRATAASATDSIGSSLVPARHRQCDVGLTILRYLATGDNQGQPSLDKRFAAYVHVPAPQARATADAYIEACDRALGAQETSAARATRNAQARSQRDADLARELADRQDRKIAACSAIGGSTENDRCYSTVTGNPSGKPGAACVRADGTRIYIEFSKSGSIPAASYSSKKSFYPGCFA